MTQPKDLVAVTDGVFATDEAALKQQATMFDRISIPPLFILANNSFESPEFKKTRAWLVETGVLFEHSRDSLKTADAHRMSIGFNTVREDVNTLLGPSGFSLEDAEAAAGDNEKVAELKNKAAEANFESPFRSINPHKYFKRIQRVSTNVVRILTIQLRSVEDLDAYAVISREISSLDEEDDSLAKHDVLKIVVELPVPDEQVAWQQIIDYRDHSDFRNQFATLKHCMSEIARGSLTPVQARETLGYLLNRHRWQLELHQMKTTTTRLETFLVSTADVLLGFSGCKDAEGLFSLEARRIALLDGESASHGSVVGYVMNARSIFWPADPG